MLTGSESNNVFEKSKPTSLVPGSSTGPVPEQSASVRTGLGSVCSDTSGRKNCQGVIASRVPTLTLEMKSNDVQNMVQNIVCEENTMKTVPEINPDVSVAQLSEENIAKYGGSVGCHVDEETSDMSKMCAKCEKHRQGCVCERSAAIGQGITNQEAVKTICRKHEHNIHSMGESKLKSGRGAQLPSSAVVKISEKLLTKQKDISSEGRGARVTIPAIFGKKLSTPLKQLNTHRRGESKQETLTPIKRKLIQNCNTQTMLKVFKQQTDEPPGCEGGVEMESPAKRRKYSFGAGGN